ncbi:MAG TPA: hypothetical protein VHL53_19225, partial [Acidimicrobiia bacterium]|nr:hypothetical protein [Acidimicrobiia bacterium]
YGYYDGYHYDRRERGRYHYDRYRHDRVYHNGECYYHDDWGWHPCGYHRGYHRYGYHRGY